MAGAHVLDLVSLALGATGDVAHHATACGLRAARAPAGRQSVLGATAQPRPVGGGRRQGERYPERYLRQLFADIGTSFSDFLIERRLELAHRLLANPLYRNRRIAEIALEGGLLRPVAFQSPLSRPLRRDAVGRAREREANVEP